uniref:glutathione transferase n=1 Tax=Salix viminalis TaxID=40686 RepID=A0A6N2L8T7_SALVM
MVHGDEQEEGFAASMENLKYLEEEIRGKKFFGGETIGLADIALGWLAYYLDIFEEIVEEVKVFSEWSSPFALRIIWALKLKGVEFDTVHEDITNKSPLLLQYNPIHKKVPVLVHDGKVICESLVILEYIDETWKQNPLLPEDPHQKANARFWAKFGDDKVSSSIWLGVLLKEGKEQEKGVSATLEYLKYLEEEIRGKKFFGGETIGLADLALGWLTYYLDIFEEILGLKLIDQEKLPSMAAWKQEFANAPIIRENWPDRDKLLNMKYNMAEEVKVFSEWSSPFALRIIWALKLKGVEFDTVHEDITNKSPLLLQYNPIHKKVPVLVHDGKVICESLVILEYIDETWKQNPLLPEDPHQKANARFWAKFGDDKVMQSIGGGVLLKEGKEQEEGFAASMENLKYLEEEIRGKKFFGGETIGLADIALGWLAYYLDIVEEIVGLKLIDQEKFPSLAAWKQEFANAPIIRENWPDRDKLQNKSQIAVYKSTEL